MFTNRDYLQLVLESIDKITEDKTPAQQAHDLGLTHTGYGYWADSSGKVIARTVKGNLVRLENPEDIPDHAEDEDNDTEQVLYNGAQKAASKLTNHALDYMDVDAADSFQRSAVLSSLLTSVYKGAVHLDFAAEDRFTPEQTEELKEFIQTMLNSESSKLVKFVKMFQNSIGYTGKKPLPAKQDVKNATTDDPYQSHADASWDNYKNDTGLDVETPASSGSADNDDRAQPLEKTDGEIGKVDISKALTIIGVDEKSEHYDALMNILAYMDKATTGSELNYAKKKFNSLDLYGEGNKVGKGSVTWDRWKQLSSYVRSTKADYKTGAQNPGKIKSKKDLSQGTKVSSSALEIAGSQIGDRIIQFMNQNGLNVFGWSGKHISAMVQSALTLPEGVIDINSADIFSKDGKLSKLFSNPKVAEYTNTLLNKVRDRYPQFVKKTDEAPPSPDAPPTVEEPPAPVSWGSNVDDTKRAVSSTMNQLLDDLGLVYMPAGERAKLTGAVLAVANGADPMTTLTNADIKGIPATSQYSTLLTKSAQELKGKLITPKPTEEPVNDIPPSPPVEPEVSNDVLMGDGSTWLKRFAELIPDKLARNHSSGGFFKFYQGWQKISGRNGWNTPLASPDAIAWMRQTQLALAKSLVSGSPDHIQAMVDNGSMSQEEADLLKQQYEYYSSKNQYQN